MHATLLIKILEITLFGFMFSTRGSNDLAESGNNTQCFQTNF